MTADRSDEECREAQCAVAVTVATPLGFGCAAIGPDSAIVLGSVVLPRHGGWGSLPVPLALFVAALLVRAVLGCGSSVLRGKRICQRCRGPSIGLFACDGFCNRNICVHCGEEVGDGEFICYDENYWNTVGHNVGAMEMGRALLAGSEVSGAQSDSHLCGQPADPVSRCGKRCHHLMGTCYACMRPCKLSRLHLGACDCLLHPAEHESPPAPLPLLRKHCQRCGRQVL